MKMGFNFKIKGFPYSTIYQYSEDTGNLIGVLEKVKLQR